MKKRILSMVMVLFITATLTVGFSACKATEGETETKEATEISVEKLTYELNEAGDGIVITGCDETVEGIVAIPKEIDGKPVMTIKDGAFRLCEGITGIIIPDKVVSIDKVAFDDCLNLTEIAVNKKNSEFSSIDGVLFNKKKTTLLAFPTGKEGAYTVPNGVKIIGEEAFFSCTDLTEVTISDSVTTIGDRAFSRSSLKNIAISNSVTTIGKGAFLFCSGLKDITIPDSVITIGESAFAECDIVSVSIGSGVTEIGNSAFIGCRYMKEVNVDTNNPKFLSQDGVVFDKEQTAIVVCPAEKEGTYKIPQTVTVIKDGAFCNCSGLTSIEIPENVTEIGGGAFFGCISLTSIIIPQNVTVIGEQAFGQCEGLTSVIIPDGVTTIGESAFSFCTALTEITIPDSVTTIGEDAFENCDNVTINCSAGSYAETYAKENNIPFKN